LYRTKIDFHDANGKKKTPISTLLNQRSKSFDVLLFYLFSMEVARKKRERGESGHEGNRVIIHHIVIEGESYRKNRTRKEKRE